MGQYAKSFFLEEKAEKLITFEAEDNFTQSRNVNEIKIVFCKKRLVTGELPHFVITEVSSKQMKVSCQ